MLLIGLTGNIASGKSEVARMLAERGATLIDADVLAREAVRPETQALRDIVKRWGKDVLKKDGSLKRARADYCIDNTGSLEDLERDVDALWSSLQRDAAPLETAAQVS